MTVTRRSSGSGTPTLNARNAGVFANNKSKAIHRWYPFVEGYSSELVEWGLRVSVSPSPQILDPFGGSGTTALTAAEHGLDSWYCEVNPFLAWLADVKVNQSQQIAEAKQLRPLQALLAMLRTGRAPKSDANPTHPLLAVESRRAFFPDGVAERIVKLLAWLDQETDGPVREIGRAAVVVSLVPSSAMIRRTDLRRRTPSDPAPRLLEDAVANTLNMIIDDLQPDRSHLRGRAQKIAADVRSLTTTGDHQFDLIITSPPYLNGTNYCRNTKLEMLALGLIDTEDGLAKYRTDSITAGINNVSKRRSAPDEIPEVEVVALQLDRTAYDKRIPALVRLYFSDMRAALKVLRNSVTDRAELLLDIGDSRFAGVNVPTHDLLGQLASHVGWRHVETIPIRERRSYDGSKLVQVLLRMAAQ